MRRLRVMVVEDEALLAMTLQDWLEDWGFEVVGPAMTVKAATELATSAEIDLAILDVNIGGTNSYGIAALLSQRAVPFVFATGYRGSAEEAGGPGTIIVHKPYRSDELRDAMTAALRAGPAKDLPNSGVATPSVGH